MKVTRRLNPSTIVEAEGQTIAEVFEMLSALEEVFGAKKCGLCAGLELSFRTREINAVKFHEVFCVGCGAKFSFGMRKAPPGQLFPQRRTSAGTVKPDGGWSRYVANGAEGGAK